MRIRKAVITAASRHQRTLPLQSLIDRDGQEKSVLDILVAEAVSAGALEVAVVVTPGDEARYGQVAGRHAARLVFIPQPEPLGYAQAVYCARDFVADEPFLHLVGDHLYISSAERGCAQRLVDLAESETCAVSSVQATRESRLPYFGAVGGRRVPGRNELYLVETVLEKPTPTEAETRLLVPGLRAGHYLCFFGMHVLTPALMGILAEQLQDASARPGQPLSNALAILARREKYLAVEEQALRYDLGDRYGLLTAQLALALSGQDRDAVLTRLLELMAQRELRAPRRPG
jgi:UTP--glucose-1-phosphate uridylyltransferase